MRALMNGQLSNSSLELKLCHSRPSFMLQPIANMPQLHASAHTRLSAQNLHPSQQSLFATAVNSSLNMTMCGSSRFSAWSIKRQRPQENPCNIGSSAQMIHVIPMSFDCTGLGSALCDVQLQLNLNAIGCWVHIVPSTQSTLSSYLASTCCALSHFETPA